MFRENASTKPFFLLKNIVRAFDPDAAKGKRYPVQTEAKREEKAGIERKIG